MGIFNANFIVVILCQFVYCNRKGVLSSTSYYPCTIYYYVTFVCLCCDRLVNAVMGPGTVKANGSKLAFKMMENINLFLMACENYGVNKLDLFQTADLYDNQNMWQVICGIEALGRKVRRLYICTLFATQCSCVSIPVLSNYSYTKPCFMFLDNTHNFNDTIEQNNYSITCMQDVIVNNCGVCGSCNARTKMADDLLL